MKSNPTANPALLGALAFVALIVGGKAINALMLHSHAGMLLTALACGLGTALAFLVLATAFAGTRGKWWTAPSIGCICALLVVGLRLLDRY